MPHAASIIPISPICAIPPLFLFVIGFFFFGCLIFLPFLGKRKKIFYKDIAALTFPILAISTILTSFVLLVMLHNQNIEKELYTTLNEIAHKKEVSQYEQAYFEIELAQLAYLEEHYTLSISSSHSFKWTDNPKDIFYGNIK